MMATTHALAGVVLALAVATVAPGTGEVPILAAALGGLFPDFDLYTDHRKTLHFPVYFSVAAAVAAVVAAVVSTTATLAVALFFAAAALHSVMDVAGGGLELRPWHATSDRAVYDHFRGRWLPPRRWIRYDGAPEDLALAAALAVPAFVSLDGPLRAGVAVALAISAVYVLLRKSLVDLGEFLVDALPPHVLAYVPDPILDDYR